jgi:hypothetical protein
MVDLLHHTVAELFVFGQQRLASLTQPLNARPIAAAGAGDVLGANVSRRTAPGCPHIFVAVH